MRVICFFPGSLQFQKKIRVEIKVITKLLVDIFQTVNHDL
jgi:hypothetical protein